MTKKEVFNEIRQVLRDAESGNDTENIIKRFSVAVTKLDALAEKDHDSELAEMVKALDAMRFDVFKEDGQKAHEVMKKIKEICSNNT